MYKKKQLNIQNLLILGGSTEALLIAQYCYTQGIASIYSLKGVTQNPALPNIKHRIGGFGGVQGLINYCQKHHITHIIDATNPFSLQMNKHAYEACAYLGLELLCYMRPQITQQLLGNQPMDMASTMADIQHYISHYCQQQKTDICFFSALGHDGAQHLLQASTLPKNAKIIARMIEKSTLNHAQLTIIYGTIGNNEAEQKLWQHYNCQHIIMRDSGHQHMYDKIKIAQKLQMNVILLKRPGQKKGHLFNQVDALCAHIAQSVNVDNTIF